MKLDESCISNSKLEISDWTHYRADWAVQFEISSFEFEMQDSSNSKFPFPALVTQLCYSLIWEGICSVHDSSLLLRFDL